MTNLSPVNPEHAPATLADFVEGLASHGERTAIIEYRPGGKTSVDYAALLQRIRRATSAFGRAGVGTGSTVALWGPNSIDWVAAYFAVIRAGALVVPLDHQSSADALAPMLAHAAPDLIITTATHRAELAAAGRTTRTIAIEALSAAASSSVAPSSGDNDRLPALDPDGAAALLYTSGTTGAPKAVPLTHRNLVSNALALAAARLIATDDRVLLPLPLHHTYPFTVGLMTALAKGATVVFPAGVSGPEIGNAARDSHATALLAVPRLCEALWDGIRSTVEARGPSATRLFHALLAVSGTIRSTTGFHAGRWLFRSLHDTLGGKLKLVGCGGAHLDLMLANRLEALGWTVLTGYGLTETSPVLTFNERGHARLGSEGRPLTGVEVAIRAADGSATQERAAAPRQGEIIVRGTSVFRGYRGNDAATQAAFTTDGWFRTGDLGWIDPEGYLHIAGRTKELIVLADGKKVLPEEVEKAYAASKLLREVAILEDHGGLAALVVPNDTELRDRGTLREAALLREEIEDIGARLPPYQRLVGYRVVRDALPRTQLGKLKRHLLRALYAKAANAGAAKEAPVWSAEDTALLASARAAEVWRWLQTRFPGRALTLDTSPQLDLEIDSLGWVALTLEIEQRFRVALTGEAVARILLLRDLLREIEAVAPAEAGVDPAARPAPSVKPPTIAVALPSAPMRALGGLIFALCRPVMRVLFRLEVSGRQHLESDTPMLIAPNHASYLDPLALAAAMPWRRLRKTFWAGWVGILYTGPFTTFFSRACQVLPVDPDRDLAAAIETAREVLRRGYSIVWFPEGRRSPTGELGPFLYGMGRVVLRSEADVMPVAIRGTFDAWPKQRLLPRFKRISVTFGQPLRFRDDDSDGRAAVRISNDTEASVRALLHGDRSKTPNQSGRLAKSSD